MIIWFECVAVRHEAPSVYRDYETQVFFHDAFIISIFHMAFFRITATQYLTALALVQDYRRHVCFLRPPPTPMLYISIPARL